jgi:hypothetical protein
MRKAGQSRGEENPKEMRRRQGRRPPDACNRHLATCNLQAHARHAIHPWEVNDDPNHP